MFAYMLSVVHTHWGEKRKKNNNNQQRTKTTIKPTEIIFFCKCYIVFMLVHHESYNLRINNFKNLNLHVLLQFSN